MIVPPNPVEKGSMPRARMAMNANPMSPNTAPDAPTVRSFGCRIMTPRAPAPIDAM